MSDPLDVISLDDAKVAINYDITESDSESRLQPAITALSRRLDDMVGPIVQREVTEYHDGSAGTIWPHQTPVVSITSLTEYDGSTEAVLVAETFGTRPDGAYLLEQSGSYAHDARIVRRSGGSNVMFPYGSRNVELVYVAGRAASTADVDALFREAAGMILRRYWRREAGSWTQSADFFEAAEPSLGTGFFKVIDSVVGEFLAHEMKMPAVA